MLLIFLAAEVLAQDRSDEVQLHRLPHHFPQGECKGVEKALQTMCLPEAFPASRSTVISSDMQYNL